MSKERVFVYGTLKSGFHNHHIIVPSKFIGEAVTEVPYKFVSLVGFPAIIIDGPLRDVPVRGEVYEVDSLTPLDSLEGYPHFYGRQKISTTLGEAWVYYLTEKEFGGKRLLIEGVWNE